MAGGRLQGVRDRQKHHAEGRRGKERGRERKRESMHAQKLPLQERVKVCTTAAQLLIVTSSVCVSVSIGHVCMGAHKGQKRASDSLDWDS